MNDTPLPNPLPLFPLQTVLFPGARLALKIFEARYLDMVAQSLRDGTPFGVVCLQQGREAGPSPAGVRIERVGTLARIDEVDADTPGLLHLRCLATQRFRLVGDATQQPGGLWTCPVEAIGDDPPRAPAEAMRPTVTALADAIARLAEQDQHPFAEPYRLDDAGWVANRWCELLPVPLSAKQKLMELEDPVIRLSIVDGYLRDKQIVIG